MKITPRETTTMFLQSIHHYMQLSVGDVEFGWSQGSLPPYCSIPGLQLQSAALALMLDVFMYCFFGLHELVGHRLFMVYFRPKSILRGRGAESRSGVAGVRVIRGREGNRGGGSLHSTLNSQQRSSIDFAGYMVDVLRSNTIISSNKAQIIVKVCNIFEQLFNLNNII